MKADQAVFTSLNRRNGMSGYHLVARSNGVSDPEVRELSAWSPSHGALIVDAGNQTSVNFHPLASTQRFALSRTCQGPAEYSGRGGRQLYTHILILSENDFKTARVSAFEIYRDAMALGHLHYQSNPDPALPSVELSAIHRRRSPESWERRAEEWGLPPLQPMLNELRAGRTFHYAYSGDRIALAECLVGALDSRILPKISFSTSLKPSTMRPYRLCLVGGL